VSRVRGKDRARVEYKNYELVLFEFAFNFKVVIVMTRKKLYQDLQNKL
jgi:hypothetical protein